MKTFTILTCLFAFAFASHGICQETKTPPKSKLTKQDNLLIAVQKICPIMGAKLGSMGEPIKMKFGDQNLYLCCKACIGKSANPTHWKTILSNLAAAQTTCPIMGKPVTAEMTSTVVKGQKIFVCCPPCVEKIQAAPDANLEKINKSYTSFLKKETQANSDRLQIAAQKICAVSGQKLGSMGRPVKVKVGKEHVFVCCKSCTTKKIDPENWKTVQKNLAAAQKTCPIMGKPVDSTMKSAVVNGRKIYVCCPPCIDKITADPVKYVAQLNKQYAQSIKK